MTNSKNLRRRNYAKCFSIVPTASLMMMFLFVRSIPVKGNNVICEKTDTAVIVKNYSNSVIEDERIYDCIDKLPSFPGGKSMLKKYLHDNMIYPHEAAKNGIMGSAVVQFVVRKDGSITNIRVLRSIEPGIDEEAVRLVESMPKWIPGEKDGAPINVGYKMRIDFVLNK